MLSHSARLRLVSGSAEALDEPTAAGIPGHDVQFYENEDFLSRAVTKFLVDGVHAGQPAIVIATEEHRAQFEHALAAAGLDLEQLAAERNIGWLEAHATLAAFMEGGSPDRELFAATVGSVFEKVLRDRPYLVVRAYGEMVDLLWKSGNVEGAIELEELWNGLAVTYSFSLLCAYSMGNFLKEAHTDGFRRICDHHQRVLPTESVLEAAGPERLRQIAILQQRARALEVEIKHRKELETALRDVLAQRRHMEAVLRRREAELQEALDASPIGVRWVTLDGTVLWANRAELRMLGVAREGVVGRSITDFHADRDEVGAIMARLARHEMLEDYVTAFRCCDGTTKRVSITTSEYREDDRVSHTRWYTRELPG